MLSVVAIQIALEAYSAVTNSGIAEFGGHLAFALLWVVFGLVAFRQHGTTRLTILTVPLLVAGALLYVLQIRISPSQPFQRA
ncbi:MULTISPECIES: hypothetical protein [Haladaptatus]|nr:MULTISPECIES: hypothetical protein [Haladaptatus]